MTLIAIAAEAAEQTDLLSVIVASLLGGGSVALVSRSVFAWAATRKRPPRSGKYGWKWGTWLAVVDLEALEKELEREKAEAAIAKAEAAKEIERARAIQREAEARVAKADAQIQQCQEHTALAIRERDRLALAMANKYGGEQ